MTGHYLYQDQIYRTNHKIAAIARIEGQSDNDTTLISSLQVLTTTQPIFRNVIWKLMPQMKFENFP